MAWREEFSKIELCLIRVLHTLISERNVSRLQVVAPATGKKGSDGHSTFLARSCRPPFAGL